MLEKALLASPGRVAHHSYVRKLPLDGRVASFLVGFFLYLAIFLKYSRNEPVRNLFLSSVPFELRQSGWRDSSALARLIYTWTLGAMSIRPVPPHLSVSKMSHVILNDMTLV
jgi:hypothetical protein